MLTITNKQMEVLRGAVVDVFVDTMACHVRTCFAAQFKLLGEARIRQIVRSGMERAGRHGFRTRRSVCLYLNLMLRHGTYFDADPQLPWVSEALQEGAHTGSESRRIDRLYASSEAYLDRVWGIRGEHLDAAIDRIPGIVARFFTEPSSGSDDDTVTLLYEIFPQKGEELGVDRLRELVRLGAVRAARHGFSSPTARASYVGFMFLLGSAFDGDPQYPWVASILEDAELQDPSTRMQRLLAKSLEQIALVRLASHHVDAMPGE
jgi:hypothetical protein